MSNKNTFFCYSLLLGQFQLKLFYCGKGGQNFASNVTLYPCERSRQNHQVVVPFKQINFFEAWDTSDANELKIPTEIASELDASRKRQEAIPFFIHIGVWM